MGPPIFIALFLKYKQCFHEIIINNDSNHNNYDATMCQPHPVPTLTVLVKKYTPCQVWSQYSKFTRHILCSIRFWCGFVCQGVFFLTSAVCKAVDFTLALLYPNFKLQLSYNISWTTAPISIVFADFNASSLYYTTVVIRRPEIWGPNLNSILFKVYISSVFMKT